MAMYVATCCVLCVIEHAERARCGGSAAAFRVHSNQKSIHLLVPLLNSRSKHHADIFCVCAGLRRYNKLV